jgi:putative transposase
VSHKDKKAFAADLKTIYHASNEQSGHERMITVTAKWENKYPNSMKRWATNRDVISPMFKFSSAVRNVIYTTNSIESLNSGYRRLNRQRNVFPSSTALAQGSLSGCMCEQYMQSIYDQHGPLLN